MSEMTRKDFEAWITAPPYEKSLATIAGNGAWPGQYVSYEVQLAWEAFAAARREVETVTREKFAWQQAALNVGEILGATGPAGYYEMSAADWREWALRELDTSRAALEDVRRVEAWIQAGNAPDLPEHSIAGLVNARYGAIVRWEDEETTVATGDSLEALGRALAQEAGDGR